VLYKDLQSDEDSIWGSFNMKSADGNPCKLRHDPCQPNILRKSRFPAMRDTWAAGQAAHHPVIAFVNLVFESYEYPTAKALHLNHYTA
jgi:hypothetical protein